MKNQKHGFTVVRVVTGSSASAQEDRLREGDRSQGELSYKCLVRNCGFVAQLRQTKTNVLEEFYHQLSLEYKNCFSKYQKVLQNSCCTFNFLFLSGSTKFYHKLLLL
jgi:hypothetical protein